VRAGFGLPSLADQRFAIYARWKQFSLRTEANGFFGKTFFE
jgi:hypothetical protein